MSIIAVQFVKRMLLPVALLLTTMIGLGLLVTRVFSRDWPFTLEPAANRELAQERSGELNNVSLVFSTLANTEVVIVITAIAALISWGVLNRWREPVFLIAAVSAQALIFLLTTLAIDRNRPAVEKMDISPPTSSFPSGHTSAAVALYCGIGLLLALHARRTSAKVAWFTLLLTIPIGVALTRMYRGMHHPSDVIASFINGGTCLAIMGRAVLDRRARWGPERPARRLDPGPVSSGDQARVPGAR